VPNPYWNKQVSNLKTPSVSGKKPLASGSKSEAMPEHTAAWAGLPGKSGPERSAGVTKAKVYPKSDGL